jgi:hypothetical protein
LKSSSNEHNEFKKNIKNRKLVHISVICDMVMRKKNKLGVRSFHGKNRGGADGVLLVAEDLRPIGGHLWVQ